MNGKIDPRKILENVQKAERAFFDSTFLAPVIQNGAVQTRIAGIVHSFRVKNDTFAGWAVLRPLSLKEAEIIGEPAQEEITRYLEQFPVLRVILARRNEKFWLACPVNLSEARARLGLKEKEIFLPLFFVEGALDFEQIVTRFDGSTLWFEDQDARRDLQVAAQLREAIQKKRNPDKVRILTLTPEEKMAYAFVLGMELEAQKNRVQERLEHALEHSGASLRSYIDRGDVLTVSWQVDGRQYTSTVAKDNFSVVAAGICLSGQDRRFDLASLVSVVREGRRRGLEHRVGPNDQWYRDHYRDGDRDDEEDDDE